MALFSIAYQFSIKFPAGASVGATGVFDFNGDGFDDLVIAPLKWPPSYGLLPIIVVRNNANGTFTDVSGEIVGGIPGVIHPREIITGDFNGDGLQDVFIADHGYDADPFPGLPNRLLLTENGGLRFSEGNLPGLVDYTHSTSTADIDGDGDLDIIVGNMYGENMYGPYIMINDGAGNFSISTGSLPASVASTQNGHYTSQEFGDINGDGAPDLFMGSGSGYHRILWNDGTGKFIDNNTILPAAFGGQSQAVDVDFFDVNGDGLMDILVNSYRYDFTGVGTQLFVQQPDGTFIDEAAQRFGVSEENVPYWRQWNYLVDFDGDGDLDILSTYNGPDVPKPDLWINEGGYFTRTKLDFLPSYAAHVGDFDGNGTPDIVSIGGDGLVSIFLNQTPPGVWQVGTAGNDIINIRSGARIIDGLAGIDTVKLGAERGPHSITLNNDGSIHLSSPSGENYTLISIERLQFDDGTLAFDFDGNAGQAYRLYQAAFDRVPDTEGLSYWVGRLDSGTTSLKAVADSFIHSPEFARTYGTQETVTNSEYVELLYLHTLGRISDPSGFDYWVEKLDTHQTNRGDLLAFFSESDENVARTADAVADGIWLG